MVTPDEINYISRYAEESWVEDTVPAEVVAEATKGLKLVKEYTYGKYGEISVEYYRGGWKKVYVVRNNVTGAVKLVTTDWNRADTLARQLAGRYNALSRLLE